VKRQRWTGGAAKVLETASGPPAARETRHRKRSVRLPGRTFRCGRVMEGPRKWAGKKPGVSEERLRVLALVIGSPIRNTMEGAAPLKRHRAFLRCGKEFAERISELARTSD